MDVLTMNDWKKLGEKVEEEALRRGGMVVIWDKPRGVTSHDVVYELRRDLRKFGVSKKVKVGHAGTLDPLATGVLVMLVGGATKRQDEFMKLPKQYEVCGWLGLVSDTYDIEGVLRAGNLSVLRGWSRKKMREEFEEALGSFGGKIQQRVPAFSAVKRQGKKLYEMARKGRLRVQDLPVREVEIFGLSLVSWGELSASEVSRRVVEYRQLRGQNAPEDSLALAGLDVVEFCLRVECSSGTYVRSLVHDVGEVMGVGAVVSALRRTAVGDFVLTK